ncbi:MAG TPA: OPT/YSL family transporter [Caldimonas sp.]|nr:OPT/YSL family transporter [Caldimonas sp.]HEX4233589.1 OPT/YSL family transporter [Caldimonas sp.]
MSAIPMPEVATPHPTAPRWRWLPAPGTWKYHALLLALGIFVLGPLGGLTAAYMNFSIGFFVGGQVLAGLLGSTVTFGYGADGKHGANYIQTAAASVAGMSAMGVLIQAMVWLGLPQPPMWQLVIYMLTIGMFGAGIGMLYTPILVDRMKLMFPSGLAVANILRALTDPVLLRRSVAMLGGGVAGGLIGGVAATKIAILGTIELSTSTFGAGMVVGARIGLAAVTGGVVGVLLKPYFISIGWLQAGDPPRKIMFLIALGWIMGAAIVDMTLIFGRALRRWRETSAAPRADAETEVHGWRRVHTMRLVVWSICWGAGIVAVGHFVLGQPVLYLLVALLLCCVFALVNGISLGISDSNPISSAFVVSIVILAAIGLKDPIVGLMAGTVLLVSTSVACDMQQDRSTGARLGTNRVIQFRYQAAGIFVGALLAVGFARLFMAAYPVLLLDQTAMTEGQQPAQWNAAMTFKFVGILKSLTDDKPYQRTAIWIGVGTGLLIELVRKLVIARERWQRYKKTRTGSVVDFVLDSTVLSSPYAMSFGGFVNLATSLWLGAGSVVASLIDARAARQRKRNAPGDAGELPSDMTATSLVGGGLIAGDALAALGLGLVALGSLVVG